MLVLLSLVSYIHDFYCLLPWPRFLLPVVQCMLVNMFFFMCHRLENLNLFQQMVRDLMFLLDFLLRPNLIVRFPHVCVQDRWCLQERERDNGISESTGGRLEHVVREEMQQEGWSHSPSSHYRDLWTVQTSVRWEAERCLLHCGSFPTLQRNIVQIIVKHPQIIGETIEAKDRWSCV